MKKIVTPLEMKLLDEELIKASYDSSYELMRYAGQLITEEILKEELTQPHKRTVVLAGRGNNGGDALVVAEMLLEKHFDVHIYLLANIGDCSYETQVQIHLLKNLGYPIDKITVSNVSSKIDLIYDADVIIDGIFGIGLARPMDSVLQSVVEAANQSHANIISIDIPSGINARNGMKLGIAIEADHTMIIGSFKPGNFLQDAEDHQGIIHFMDIGIKDHVEIRERYWMTEADVLSIPLRKHNSHKYDYGNILVLGGSESMMGAITLASLSAYRAGAGIVSVGLPRHLQKLTRGLLPDFLTPIYETIDDFNKIIDRKDVICFGMGYGEENPSFDFFELLLEKDVHLIIDADGLKHLKPRLKEGNFNDIIITPHYKELAILLDIDMEQIKLDPLFYAEKLSIETGLIVLLKGPATILASPNKTYISTFGTPALAVAGSGDVLDGILAAMLTRDIDMLDAAQMAIYLHATAAEEVVHQFGEDSVMASDILEQLPNIMKFLKEK